MISVGRITPDRVGELAIPKTVAKSEWIVVGVLAVFSVFTLVYPVARAFYHLQIDYNEGWNVYHAQTAMHHLPLYYPKYGWTTVNYPMLFFLYSGLLLALPRELRLLAGGTGTFSDIPSAVLYVGVSDRQNSYEQLGSCHFWSLLLLGTLLRKSVFLCGSR